MMDVRMDDRRLVRRYRLRKVIASVFQLVTDLCVRWATCVGVQVVETDRTPCLWDFLREPRVARRQPSKIRALVYNVHGPL